MYRFTQLATLTLILGTPCIASAFQAEGTAPAPPKVPEAGYEAEIPQDTDPLKGEAAAETRIQDDASRIAQLAGEEMGEKLSSLMTVIFDAAKGDDERLKAAGELKQLVAGTEPGDGVMHSVARQVNRRAALVEAGVNGLKSGPAGGDARKLMNEFLVRTAVDFENSNREAYAAESRRLYKSLKQTHPTLYANVRPSIMDDYFNYNLHFILSEPLMSMLVSDFQTQSGSVADCVLGAWVTGCQSTDTMVTVDIKPCASTAKFQIIADGRTMTDTRGRKKPATVYTKGNHGFRIAKDVFFDGKMLSSGQSEIAVNANNQTVGVSTDFDQVPFLGGLARGIAFQKAQELKGQSEAIAARKLADQALPKFDQEVGEKFEDANQNLQGNFLGDLKKRGIAPESYSTRSSETHLAMSTRTINPETLAATPPPDSPAPRRGLVIQAHESVINAGLTSLNLGGPTTPIQLIETIEAALRDLTDKEVSLRRPPPKEKHTDFDFETTDPIRVRFDEDKIVFLFRTGFYQYDDGEERPDAPTLIKQVFEIPIDIAFKDGEIILTPPPLDNAQKFGAMIKQRPADSSQSKGGGAFRRAIQARRIAQQLVKAVFSDPENPDAKDKRFPAKVEVPMGDGTRLELRVTRFEISDGWITAVLQR